MDIFSMDSGFYRFMCKVGDLLVLNILFLVFSIPILTIGASTTALYTVLLRLVRGEDGYIARGFLKAFRDNLKQSTIMWMGTVFVGIVIYCDIIYSNKMGNTFGAILKIIFLFFGVIYLAVVSYLYAVQSRFDNTIKSTIKNAFWLSMGCLPFTVSLLVVEAIPLFLVCIRPKWFWYILPVMCTIGISGIIYICCVILNYVFKKHMGDEG